MFCGKKLHKEDFYTHPFGFWEIQESVHTDLVLLEMYVTQIRHLQISGFPYNVRVCAPRAPAALRVVTNSPFVV